MTIGLILIAIHGSERQALLSPGPLSFQHSAVGGCAGCHGITESGPATWVRVAFGVDVPQDGDHACRTCHDLGPDAGTAHSQPPAEMAERTRHARQRGEADGRSPPVGLALSAWLFGNPGRDAAGVGCATCHREHRGVDTDLTEMANDSCQACHAGRFASLADGHPAFGETLFTRRQRIAFDHAAHLDRSFAAADSAGKAPADCSGCHIPGADRRFMATRPFETACIACHSDDIAGAARIGRKGVDFLTVPGLDIRELTARGVDIGDWPVWSEEPLTPFMRLMLAGDDTAAAALRRLDGVDLLDLRAAGPDEIRAAAELGTAVKRLYGDLLAEGVQAADRRLATTLGRTGPGAGHVEATGVLLGHLPMEVLQTAARDWFPRLADDLQAALPHLPASIPGPQPATDADAPAPDRSDVLGTAPTPDQSDILGAAPALDQSDILGAAPALDQSDILGTAPALDQSDILGAAPALDQSDILGAAPALDQSDILGTSPQASAPLAAPVPTVDPPSALAAPAAAMQPNVDPEQWMAAGGWYRLDSALLYRPTGHRDDFLRAWLDLAAATGRAGLMTAIGTPDAPGACLKCHSIDRTPAIRSTASAEAGGQPSAAVNWTAGRHDPARRGFVRFSHAPHFSLVAGSGCQTCHAIVRPEASLSPTAFQDQYRLGDPNAGVMTNFNAPTVAICAECHVAGRAGDSCTQCHAYHVGRFPTPTLPTPMEVAVPSER